MFKREKHTEAIANVFILLVLSIFITFLRNEREETGAGLKLLQQGGKYR